MSEEGLLDRLPDGVVMVGADGKVSMVNAEAERLLGRTRESALGRDFREVLDLRDSAGRAWWGSCSPFASIAIVRGMPEREFLLRGAGSRERWVVVVGRYWRGSTGKVEQVVFGLRDATSRRLQETAKGELISTVSHEIRSPLTSIKGFTSTLLKRWDRFTPEQQRTMLQAVNSDADRVTRLIKELLDISRLEAGRMQLLRRMVDLEELSREVAGRIAGGREGWYAEVSFPEGFPEVYVDRDKVGQVLANLLENAAKYAAGCAVRVEGFVGEGVVEVAVIDAGPGIAPEHLGRIFTKFYRRDVPGSPSGTGLGLYITKGLVESHGGRIWATSEPGKGSAFRFTLPTGGFDPGAG